MEKYKKYYGVMLFWRSGFSICVLGGYYAITPQLTEHANSESSLQQKTYSIRS